MIFDALGDLARVAARTGTGDRARPTPCEGLDVDGLHQHLTGGLAYYDRALGNPSAENRGPDPHDHTGPDDLGTVITRLSATLRAAVDDGVGARTVNVPHLGGSFPGSRVIDLLPAETITHGWDLARALGLPWQPADGTCEHTLHVYRAVIRPEFRGPGLPFADEVPVDPGAPALDRLVAFVGRDPRWRPGDRRTPG